MSEVKAQSAYQIIVADSSAPEKLAESYNNAVSQGQVVASVWDGRHINIITRRGTTGGTGKHYRAVAVKSGSTEEFESSLTEATRDGGHIVSAVWDGQNVNVIVEIEYIK